MVKSVPLPLLLLLLSLQLTQTICCEDNHLVDSDYRQMYCDADVVFRGSPVMAKSSIGIDPQGMQVEGSTHSFTVQHWYRFFGTNLPAQTMIAVGRTWRQGDPCDSPSFPDPTRTSSFLVFASRAGSYYTVQTCRHSFPWVCLPDSFRNSLPLVC